MQGNKLKAEEVAALIGISTQTLNLWYKFKRENPEDELAQMLPAYHQQGKTGTRYWNRYDLWCLYQFKNNVKQGCRGFMGSVTQRYVKKKEA